MPRFKEESREWYDLAISIGWKRVSKCRDSTPSKEMDAGGKLTNTETRYWYQGFISILQDYDKSLQDKGISLEERAKMIHELRHTARMESRELMADQVALGKIKIRDKKVYGNEDGPTFESSIFEEIRKIKEFVGQSEYTSSEDDFIRESALERIIDSAQRTNETVNQALLGALDVRPRAKL